MMKKQEEYKQKIFGEYVATPIKNAFNSKTAYWLSKANCTVSIYMFTCENGTWPPTLPCSRKNAKVPMTMLFI